MPISMPRTSASRSRRSARSRRSSNTAGWDLCLIDVFDNVTPILESRFEGGGRVSWMSARPLQKRTMPRVIPDRIDTAATNATIYLAGAAPKDLEQTYKDAGVDDFISVKANCYQILRFLQKKKGMID